MKVIRFNPLSVCKIFTVIIGLFKRALCFIQRRRRNSDSLPLSMNSIQVPLTDNSTKHDIPGNEPAELQDWNDWGTGEGPTSIKVDGGQEDEPEMDFFTDMTPKIKKPVLIRKKVATDNNTTPGMSNRLTMDADIVTQSTGELGTWDEAEGNAWEDEATGNISTWEVEQAIKENKLQERERRAMEQQRKKMEREAQRASRKDGTKLAMKMS
ncbi:uncharacterized protein LOC144439722 [Glandiceps talaboti]